MNARVASIGATIIAVVALGAVVVVYVSFGLRTASTTLGCDYFTYVESLSRHLTGQALYPTGIARTGECGLYQYPPPFLLIVGPFRAFGQDGLWLWIAGLGLAFAVGCALMPVSAKVRVTIFLLGVTGWPFIFSLRIGQVVPLLFLLASLGWRFVERPIGVGIASGLGAIVKVQPGLFIVWLLARRRWRAVAVALGTMAVLSAIALVWGLGEWPAFLRMLTQISNAGDAPANFAIGAWFQRLGLAPAGAGAIQAVNTAAMIVLVVAAARWLRTDPGYLLVWTVSQIISPIVWSHYALALLLPVAWLLQRGQWWALVIPISHSWMLIGVVPGFVDVLPYYVVIAALLLMGRASPRAALMEDRVRADRIASG